MGQQAHCALDHWRRLLFLQAAARRISDAYFDGAKVLYAKTEECLAENLSGIEKVLAMAVGSREERGRPPEEGMDYRELAPTPQEVAEAADEIATAWVVNVQGAIAGEFGEDDHAVGLLGSVLLKGQ
ncbi:MAG TPA: hypothetical protein VD997_05855 [Phycisphaerales bacterium]|nr:hypothetical protein [Phycisphaerales bacterium]